MVKNRYFANFSENGILENIITLECIIPVAYLNLQGEDLMEKLELFFPIGSTYFENEKTYYQLPINTEITQDFCYKLVDNNLVYDPQILEELKLEKISQLEQIYNKALNLTITNSFTFNINLRSPEGDAFCNILKMAQGAYSDIKIGSKTQRFFTKVEEVDGLQMIECNAFNWIWLYLFEEVLPYMQNTKQLKEKYITDIQNTKTIKDLDSLDLKFPFSEGLKINISNVVEELLKIQNDGNLQIPEYVKAGINAMDRKIFRYTKVDDVVKNTQTILNDSWLII